MTRARFYVLVALAAPPLAALTLLLLHFDQRVRAVDPRDIRAIAANIRNAAYSLSATAWNARQASEQLPGVVRDAGAAVKATQPVLAAVKARINQLEKPVEDLGDTVVNLRDAIAKIRDGAGPALQHVDDLVVAAKPAVLNAGKITDEAAAAMPAVRNTLDVLSENADLLGRCATQDSAGNWIGNPDCFANRAIPAMRSLEDMATLAKIHAPQFVAEFHQFNQHADGLVKSAGGIAADGKIIADGIVAPKKWWEKLINLTPYAGAAWTAYQAVRGN